ncbi:Trm112 family protein [Oecophyllibacter saccharovorans]|nr:Trm112 family protein [Oecophyllibacter saccharovorans]
MKQSASAPAPDENPSSDGRLPGTDAAGSTDPQREVALDPRLLARLVCPVTKGPLEYDRQHNRLLSPQARLAYPVRDGIPLMLPEEATPY